MRSIAPLFLLAVAIAVALLVGAQLASAGTPEAPELTDPSGDCAVPYGNEYLDVAAAWIDGEDADSFDVHLRLAKWQEAVAEGAGYAVQFTHQSLSWGIVAVYSSVIGEGWEFSTGMATAELAQGFEEAPGSFDATTATIVVTFPKSIFPHTDPTDTTLRSFVAMSADLRPAYPFFLGEEAGLDGNGRWVVCDDATSDAAYAFISGGHSTEHAAPSGTDDPANETAVAHEGPSDHGEPALTEQPERDTPIGPLAAVGALALAALRRR